MERLALLGAGDLGDSLRTYLEDCGDASLAGVLDDGRARGDRWRDLEVLGGSGDAAALARAGVFDRLVFAIGYRSFETRASLFRKLRSEGVRFRGVAHPTAFVHRTARLGEGVHLFPGVIVDAGCRVDDNVVLNTGVILAHDAAVGAHSYFGPGARVSGFTEIGERCFVGIGSVVIEKLKVGADSVIAAGAVVLADVPPRSLVAGVPAALKKTL